MSTYLRNIYMLTSGVSNYRDTLEICIVLYSILEYCRIIYKCITILNIPPYGIRRGKYCVWSVI